MQQKTYLKWYNKIGYGSGDIAGNVVWAFLNFFFMIYLTDTVGLNSGIVGTLMALSKIFDGVTDVFFGTMIDKTKSKLGKARPWMLWPYIGNSICLIACFAIPTEWGQGAQYAFFFIAYTMLNGVFYTANNIAYGALTALITKNDSERVQMGSLRFIFANATSLIIQAVTVNFVAALGGGAEGWKWVAVIYAIIGLVVNTISVFSVKELPESELEHQSNNEEPKEKLTLTEAFKLLISNKYYMLLTCIYLIIHISNGFTGVGIFYMTYVLGDANLLGTFATATNLFMIIGLLAAPFVIKKMGGMYRINLWGYGFATLCRVLVMVGGYMGNVPMMLIFTALANIGMSPLQGDLNALIACASEYTYLTKGKRIDGTMYSCTSLGVKIGGGLGTALSGWLLDAGGYINGAAVQPESALNMLSFMYLWLPAILSGVITLVLSRMTVEKANAKLMEEAVLKA